MNFKTITVVGTTITALFILVLFIILNKCVHSLDKIDNEYKSEIGKRVIIIDHHKGNDTLTIVDYSFINSTYTLDNGKVVSVELVKRLKHVKN